IGYETKEIGDIMLTLGVTTNADFQLIEAGTQLQEVTISGNGVINSDRTGAITTISNKQITQLPTLSRSFNDYVRLTPQATSAIGGPSFAGRSNGYNNI